MMTRPTTDDVAWTPPDNAIIGFRGKWNFLSNFYQLPKLHELRPTLEHHYQAAKCANVGDVNKIMNAATPTDAKRLGRKVELVDGWDVAKDLIMLELIRRKFAHVDLRDMLLATGDRFIIHANWHHDDYWGAVHMPGNMLRGLDKLGECIMIVRQELTV